MAHVLGANGFLVGFPKNGIKQTLHFRAIPNCNCTLTLGSLL